MKKPALKYFLFLLGLFLVFSFSSNVSAYYYAPPVLDAGWAYDEISGRFTDSDYSPYTYDLGDTAMFRITDYFNPGDTYYVYDYGALILTTTFTAFATGFGDDAWADAGWTDASFGSGEILLAAGFHEITVQGDGIGGIPAGFFARLDTQAVPEPGTIFMLGFALIGLAGMGHKKYFKN